jgi:hypothetical protein
LRKEFHLHGYRSPEYIKDAGTPERLERWKTTCATGVVARSSLAVKRPAIFLDRDGTINEAGLLPDPPGTDQAHSGRG